MVAYSFRPRFVDPIRVGLGVIIPDVWPKRQTIRRWGLVRNPSIRRRHARPDEEVQLYTGMRTKACCLIGRAMCASVERVRIDFGGMVTINRQSFQRAELLDLFARDDGFDDFAGMRDFWREEHGIGPTGVFDGGALIKWIPAMALLEGRDRPAGKRSGRNRKAGA